MALVVVANAATIMRLALRREWDLAELPWLDGCGLHAVDADVGCGRNKSDLRRYRQAGSNG